jgi:hypothetical protein
MSLVSAELVSPSNTRQFNPYVAAFGVFLFFAILFLSLRTRQYLAVDGAVRALGVYHRQALFFDGNSHLLYSANIYLWSQALKLLGFQAHTPFEFIAISQALNAIAAAGCLALMFILVWTATSSAGVSLAATSAYGFSRAFVLHGTNSAQPVVGLFYSALGILIVVESLRRRSVWPLAPAGACFALALACYQSMVLIAPLALLFCVGWPTGNGNPPSWSNRWVRFTSLSSGGFAAVCAIYGWAYWTSGERSVVRMIHNFFQLEGGHVYGYLTPAKLVNSPFGLISALLPALPADYGGVRSLFREPHNIFWLTCILVVVIWLWGICGLLASPVSSKWRSVDPSQRQLILALGVALLILMGPLVYWAPLYDKLWLQPLGVIIVLFAVLYRIGSPHARRGAKVVLVMCFIASEAVVNLVWAISAHRSPTKGIEESLIVADVVKPNDFVVLNFDQVSTLYFTFWGSAQNSLLLPASRPELASSRLTRAINETRETGGHVYFLSVLDMSEEAWTAFLGNRVGIPYHSFDSYRSKSTVVHSFQLDGQTITLRRLR